ncbi:hypothetical protein [Bacillus thuringiensis]|uniref:hypothetical protein n=1 Tax=Bacillus thuringiensis TaxID=1428 RepID=UPI000BFC0470|nr:hypothetical protein [Bacillus thuringiensis]PGT89901.1 hypothetical protein COD17_09120 [Bacillus thuringiensis]
MTKEREDNWDCFESLDCPVEEREPKKVVKLQEDMVVRSAELKDGDWLITKATERQPHQTIGNRMTSYENGFDAIKLNEDGTFNKDNETIHFSTCGIFTHSINASSIKVVKVMEKTYVDVK